MNRHRFRILLPYFLAASLLLVTTVCFAFGSRSPLRLGTESSSSHVTTSDTTAHENVEPETTVSDTTTAETTVMDTTSSETTVMETSVSDTTVPETTVPETTIPETTVPETTIPETTVPETTVPETTESETTVPETTVPETTVPETTVPETTVPETTVPETTVPETTVPETTVPETTIPETIEPETTVPEATEPETTESEIATPDDIIRIYIDQGHNPHGYHDEGIIIGDSHTVCEADITFGIGLALQDWLMNDPRFEVMLSRPTTDSVVGSDAETSLLSRVENAETWEADLLLSLHCQSIADASAHGVEAIFGRCHKDSERLAQTLVTTLAEHVDSPNQGAKTIVGSSTVLRSEHFPAVILNLGYLSNVTDTEQLTTHDQRYAEGIYLGILSYFSFH